MKIVLLFSLLLLSGMAYSCSCIPLGKIDDKQYDQYDLIIKGRITKLVEDESTRIIYVKVDTYFKGKPGKATIKIESTASSGLCGIFPKIGEQWLMFAYRQNNYYHTALCTRTKNLNPAGWDYDKEAVADDLKFLKDKTAVPVKE